MKYIVAAALIMLTAGCASTQMRPEVLRAHAERNCRVEAATNRTYAIDSTGVGTINVGYQKCMARNGYIIAK